MKKILATTILAIFTTAAFAEEAKNSTYVDIGYTMLTYADSGTDFSPGAVRLIVGNNTSSNFGYEGMLGAGVASSISWRVVACLTCATCTNGYCVSLSGKRKWSFK